MDKYIVEIDGKNICSDSDGKSKLALSVKADNGYAVFCTEIPLMPYTELDLDAIRKESYDKCMNEAEDLAYKLYSPKIDEAYQRGLNDAWDAARKIANIPYGEEEKVIGSDGWTFIINHTASEAIEKIRQYEQKKEKIKIGDEVKNIQTGVKFTVTHLWENNRGEQGVSGFNQECSAFSALLNLVDKTGRHFPEVAAIFDKMRGE